MKCNSDPVEEFILNSRRNLEVAETVAQAWPQARQRLVKEFFDRVEAELKRKLRGWKYELWGGAFFVDVEPSFYAWKPAWEKQYYVALRCDDYGQKITFGISRANEYIKNRPFCPGLLNAIKEEFPSAEQRQWWEAKITMQSPAKDWRDTEVLWRMHTDAKFLKDVADQLLRVAQISVPHLDPLSRKKRR